MESEKPSENSRTSDISTIAASAAAGGGGVLALWASIRRLFYKNMAKLGTYKQLHDARENTEKGLDGGMAELSGFEKVKGFEELKTLETRLKQSEGLKGLKGTELIGAWSKINRAYSRGVDKIHADREIKNSIQKFEMLGLDQKLGVIGTAVAVTSVAMGAILNMHHKKQIAEELKEINGRGSPAAAASPAV